MFHLNAELRMYLRRDPWSISDLAFMALLVTVSLPRTAWH
jgi:hypothetical protein